MKKKAQPSIFLFLIGLFFLQSGYSQEEYKGTLKGFNNFPEGSKYQFTDVPAEERVKNLVSYLTFEETLMLTGGTNRFFIPGVPRLGLRNVFMADASQGLRLQVGFEKTDKSTSFPGMLALSATWNEKLAYKMGESLGQECLGYGVDALLGPGINFQRFSVSGRNFEYFGEDPILTTKMSVNYIKGLQSKKVLATAKHFIGNDQEFCRHLASSDIDQRTLHELYLRPWKAVVQEANVKAIMTGNNLVNGTPMALDKPLVNDMLRDKYGFEGIIMTDWQNTGYFPTLQYLFPDSGVSLLMPRNRVFSAYLKDYLQQFPEKKTELWEKLKKKVYNNLLPLFQFGVYERSGKNKDLLKSMGDHLEIAREIAEESITLLKNETNLLPIKRTKKILLTGEEELFSGVGSGFVVGYDHTDFETGLKSIYGKNITTKVDATDDDIIKADIVIYRLNQEGGEGKDIPFKDNHSKNIDRLTRLNKNVVVVISSCNGLPMPWINSVKSVVWSYFLGQERGNAMANVLSGKVNPSGKLPFTLEKDFMDSQDPTFNYLGDKPYWNGNNRSYRKYWLNDDLSENAAISQFQEHVQPHQVVRVPYKEGLLMGYRWYDAMQKEVLFPFGHGLSYTTFEVSAVIVSYESMNTDKLVEVSCNVKNTGEFDGAEVIQLYILTPIEKAENRPLKELKAFKKVHLKAGESKMVKLQLKIDDLRYWNDTTGKWDNPSGQYNCLIGTSSRQIQLEGQIKLNQ